MAKHNRDYNPEDIRFPDQVITTSNLVDEMEKSYIEYAMSVIVGRAPEGHFEQHLSRMHKRYHQKRDAVIDCIRRSALAAEITEQDAGLHFLVRLDTKMSDEELRRRAAESGLRLALLSDYYADPTAAPHHVLVVNYAGLELEHLPEALERLGKILA